ncbi:hypothetical protein EYB26_001752 [Talaromyces marneffei]|uniref:uncharacterized protein n=1 Tax=Talaromyces marneffei TaxID=37727 RepID=UPI0012A9AFB7|nr:uncharacterized protein EYB26_001752 [Talaromyces marneffei]QGA14099.1 hypothetical protein EYB26_001752 [Talaromyces marneffei]
MPAPQDSDSTHPSGAFFCPQAYAPDEEYLNGLHSFLSENKYGKSLLREISDLKDSHIWSTFATASGDVASLSAGPEYIDLLYNWAAKGASGPLAAARSSVVALPLLVILQVGQYLRYLDYHNLSHQTFLVDVSQAGGVQGFCGGLATAIAIACAVDESQVVQYTATVMRVLIGVGAYSEAADDTRGSGSTTLALRLKYEGQGEELTQNFPGTYVSAITEPLNISIVGPAGTLHELFIFAKEQEQLQVQKMDIRGKSHNPENQKVAGDLCTVCDGTQSLRLPDASELRAPVRSNISGRRLTEGSLTNELVTTILANRCEWYSILTQTAKDIKAQSNDTPGLVYFGMTDVVSLAPFVQQGLQPAKTAAHTLIARITKSPVDFPEDAIAVVGASCRLPGANNFEELWELLASGADQHRPLGTDRFNIYDSFRASQSGKFGESKFYGNFIDDVRRFDNAFFGVNQREAASMDPQQRLLLEVAYEALDDAGYLVKHCRENGDNVGCFIGGSLVEYLDNTSAYAPTAYVASGTIRAFLCGRLSYYFGWSGPAEVIDTACSSSLVAINRACKAIQAGECFMALCGGVNIITGMNNYFDLGKAGFLSPTGQCKPFDASGDGYCRSDGVGLVVLKKLSQAIVDGDAVMAVIPGISTNQGGLSPSITIPHSTAQQALYKRVLQQAQIPPESVTYIEAHGTGTQAGDPIEVESLRSVFGKKMLKTSSDRTLHIGSIKGNLGHCETAAGVTGLLKVLAMIKHAQLPPHASYGRLNPKIPPLEPDGLSINRSLCDWKTPFRAALVNSYGAAGSNCALLCCELPSKMSSRAKDVDVKLPLLVSAASEKSLLQNAQVLSAHLRKHALEINLGDLAHTLNERRKRHKFLMPIDAVDVQDAASQLENLQFQSIVQNASRTPRPVVLVFSGQFDNKVQLDKAFYDKIPAFRHYLDLCDKELVAQGFPTIMPTIFDTEPAADATLLQCGIFAMQYASAQCWIDAGLTPSAVIGHSLGELTALAVSGVLSLADAIKLVASRARLIDTKWGSDKGSMLAMSNCSASEFEAICSLLQQRSGSVIEIACYNAVDTIIASGASANIARLKEIVCSEPRFQKIRARDLATTHGFHSSLTETLIADMTVTSQSLKWNEPKIPLETCSNNPIDSFKEYDPSRHLREPVFFVDAIQRLEKRFPSAVWLEAGISTPAVVMARSASGQANAHAFLGLKASGTLSALDSLSSLVSDLWRNGHFVQHWRLVSPSGKSLGFKPIWLPPYQFERTQHWVANVDRVMEMQQTVSKAAAESMAVLKAPENSTLKPPTLVGRATRRATKAEGQVDFTINIQTQRFHQVVRGHYLRSRSLCPASMYMEAVTMALQLLAADGNSPRVAPGAFSLVWDEVNFHAPLGTEARGEVVVRLSPARHENIWNFAICTLPGDGSSSRQPRETVHVKGVVSLVKCLSLDAWERLVSGPMERITSSEIDTERFMRRRTYGLFARLVEYAPFFKGIHSLVLHEREGVATICMPDEQPAREESTSWSLCDTVTIDAFIQVLGFVINTSDFVPEGEVAVMVGLDRAVISPKCDFSTSSAKRENWRVYARFGVDGGGQPLGDVFVWNIQDNNLVAVFTGCRFSKVPISKLERSLDQAMRLVTPSQAQPTAGRNVPVVGSINSAAGQNQRTAVVRFLPDESSSTSSSSSDTDSRGSIVPTAGSISSVEPDQIEDQLEELQNMIAESTGMAKSDMTKAMMLADMGLDSLAALDLVGEFSSKFNLKVAAHDLQNMTFGDLSSKLASNSPTSVASLSRPAAPEADGVGKAVSPASQPLTDQVEDQLEELQNLIAECTGMAKSDMTKDMILADMGLDSLAAVDLVGEFSARFNLDIASHDLQNITLEVLGTQLAGNNSVSVTLVPRSGATRADSVRQLASVQSAGAEKRESNAGATVLLGNPFEALKLSDAQFDTSAKRQGYFNHHQDAAPYEDEILLAHIIEALATLGIDLSRVDPRSELPQIPHLPKYDKLVARLWEILQHHGFVKINTDGKRTRSDRAVDGRSSATLLAAFKDRFPGYKYQSDLIGLTGPRLAEVLSGKLDSVALLFGSPASLKIMASFYDLSPMMSTLTDQLVVFLGELLRNVDKSRNVRILEVGAGTCGTTKRVLAALASANIATTYTFTDISASLVQKAKTTLKEYNFIEYDTFNLEKEVPESFRGRFDVVISTNCVHATTDRTKSCRRLRDTLAPGGILVLSELTRVIDWYDTCFGLLDGWWLAEGRTLYPVQPAERWMSVYENAGFASYGHSWGPTLEATSQQLLVACNEHWTVPQQCRNPPP